MAQTTGRVPIPRFRKPGEIEQTGYSSWSNVPTMGFGQESMQVGMPTSRGRHRSFASRDPVAGLAAARRRISAAGKRFWGRGGPPPSRAGGGESSMFYGSRTREGVLQTGYGVNRPKQLAFRRFTSKWTSPPGGRGLLQPNPSYMGGAGGFDPGQASRMGMGRMRTTFPRYST